jgi:hypothetical protein
MPNMPALPCGVPFCATALRLMASFEVKGMARDLFDLAQTQSPMGTLPRTIDEVRP